MPFAEVGTRVLASRGTDDAAARRWPVTTQLVAGSLVALVAIAAVGIVSVTVITRQRVAMDNLALLSRIQRILQDADMEHDLIRADVLAVDNTWTGRSPADFQRQLTRDIELYREYLTSAEQMPLPADVRKAITETEPELDAYLTRAVELARLAGADPHSASDKGEAFQLSFDRLSEADKRLTDLLADRVSNADATADAAARFAGWAIGVACLLAFLVVATVGRLVTRSVSLALGRVRAAQEQDAFSRHLSEVLDMADTESDAHDVVARGMKVVSDDMPMELLVADSSRAHLERATSHPTKGAPGCGVESPYGCMAVRRGNPIVFADSDALNSCGKLRNRACGPVSAVCVPLSFMGRSLGVLHATGPVHQPPPNHVVSQLTTLGILAGSRIGTVRAFQQTQVQARTDGLTGLANRRSLELRVRTLENGAPYAFVLADLDHFKRLNDKHGHDAGDRALKVFADVLRQSLRDGDHPARWGGEEFAILFEGRTASEALEIVNRIRAAMATAMQGAPAVTASFGVADSSMARAFEQILRIADDALYQSKEGGRDRGTIGDPQRSAGGIPRRQPDHLTGISLEQMAEAG